MAAYTTLARPYAKAAFSYALDNNALKPWSEFLQAASFVVSSPEVQDLLVNPSVVIEEKKQFLIDILQVVNITKQQQNFIETLCFYKRLLAIPDIQLLFQEYCKRRDKTMEVEVTSAYELSKDQLNQLQKALEIRLQYDINIKFAVDEHLIGGAVVRAGDFVIDGSTARQLRKLKTALISE